MKTEELQNKSYEELVQLQQEGKITTQVKPICQPIASFYKQ